MRRVVLGLTVLLSLSALGLGTLISSLTGGRARSSLVAGAVAIALFGVFIFAIRRFGVPFGSIVEAANRIADGDYSARADAHGPPSIRAVSTAFNSMASTLEVQDRQRRQLMADIAHELRTPLSVVQGRLEGLLDGVYARDDEQLERVLEDTRMLSRLVEDLRTLAHAESGMLALNKEPTDLTALVEDAASTMASEASLRHVSLKTDIPADAPLQQVDQLRIREVLLNLLSNALQYTPAGGTVTVSAAFENGRATIAVQDTGSGIGKEQLPKIFDRFHKGASSTGSGLGLAIARNLVLAHDGQITAESEVGKGTKIVFTV